MTATPGDRARDRGKFEILPGTGLGQRLLARGAFRSRALALRSLALQLRLGLEASGALLLGLLLKCLLARLHLVDAVQAGLNVLIDEYERTGTFITRGPDRRIGSLPHSRAPAPRTLAVILV